MRGYGSPELLGAQRSVGADALAFFTDVGVPYIHLGENLAERVDSADATNTAWMNSPEHKANILDSKFTDVGFAVCKTDNSPITPGTKALIVVQHFAEL